MSQRNRLNVSVYPCHTNGIESGGSQEGLLVSNAVVPTSAPRICAARAELPVIAARCIAMESCGTRGWSAVPRLISQPPALGRSVTSPIGMLVSEMYEPTSATEPEPVSLLTVACAPPGCDTVMMLTRP